MSGATNPTLPVTYVNRLAPESGLAFALLQGLFRFDTTENAVAFVTYLVSVGALSSGVSGGNKWRIGEGVPDDSLGDTGDIYLDSATSDVYQKGATNYAVVANIQGAKGDAGTAGTNGTAGEKGDTGEAGTAGAPGTLWRVGAALPDDAVGIDGDLFLNTATGDVFQRATGAYAVVMNVRGPAGDKGADGASGGVWRSGAAAPSDALGADNDFYLNTSTGDVSQRTSGAYAVVMNITGPRGNTGSAGADTWGSIGGILSAQADLAAALAALQPLDAIGTAIASSSTPNIGSATGNTVHITGTTGITGFAAATAGLRRTLIFDASLAWSYNSTSMLNPYGQTITTQAGDIADVICLGSNNWQCVRYQRKNGSITYATLTIGGNITWEPSINPFLICTISGQVITMNNPVTLGFGQMGIIRNYTNGNITITGAVVSFGINSTANVITLLPGQSLVVIGTSNGWGVIGGQYSRHKVAQAIVSTGTAATIASLTSIGADGGGAHHVAINAWINVITRTTNTVQMQVTWTDEQNISRTQILFPMGSTTSAIAATGFVCYPQFTICANSTNPITVSTTIPTGGGSISFDAGATIEQLH